MTSAFTLSLPTDIPWKRICVSEDMLDRVVCDTSLPAKWQSSVAVFRYVPEDEYQQYPDYEISYLKVTATITGYQALEDEIQGEIDWDSLDTTTLEGVTQLLDSYFPCTGAIVQVVIGPGGGRPLEEYPFFLDFEPKKRELYEMATDTRERQSRSAETLQVTKSSGTTQSQEVLDVDMGGSTSFGAQGSYAGTGGGFNFSSSNQGQWGTKSLNTQQSQTDRTREVGQELRESFSFTTQLSQMYHLLDSYHLGTNRAVFFVQPRPHVLEEPTGFVDGPRKVEGIQEFFLVVAKPKEAPEYCVSVRLDTAHLAETDILAYETRADVTDLANAYAPIPTENDQPADPAVKALARACTPIIGSPCWDVRYRCFMTRGVDDVAYSAPAGFSITGYNSLVNDPDHGFSTVTIAPGNRTLAIHAEAEGHIAIEAGWDVCVDCPDELEKWAGSARRQVQVNLRSDEPTVKTGTQTHLLLTTRGVCCCEGDPILPPGVIDVFDIPAWLGGVVMYGGTEATAARTAVTPDVLIGAASSTVRATPVDEPHLCQECAGGGAPKSATEGMAGPARRMSIRQANAMTNFIRDRMVNVARRPGPAPEPVPFAYSEAFIRQLIQYTRRSRRGRERLDQPAAEAIPRKVADALAKQLGKKAGELTARDVLGFRERDLARLGAEDRKELARARLRLLGVPATGGEPERPPTQKGRTRRREGEETSA